MAAHLIELVGLLTAEPATLNGSASDSLDLGFKRNYGASDGASVTINSTVDAPYVINQAAISSCRLFALRVVGEGATVKVYMTSGVGADQVIPVSGLYVWQSPLAGDELAAIKIVGTADIEYLVAGDGTAASPPPPPPTSDSFVFEVARREQVQVLAADGEVVIADGVINSDEYPIGVTSLEVRAMFAGIVSAGTGTLRVRLGTTAPSTSPVGAIVASFAFAGTSWASLAPAGASLAKPASGARYLQVTLQQATAGETASVRGVRALLKG